MSATIITVPAKSDLPEGTYEYHSGKAPAPKKAKEQSAIDQMYAYYAAA